MNEKIIICLGLVVFGSGVRLLKAQHLSKEKLMEIARRETRAWEINSQKIRPARGKKISNQDPSYLMIFPIVIKGKLPLVYEPANLASAQAVNNDQIWTGGSAALNLTGLGHTIGYWDADRPLLTHPEYSGRVSFVDTASSSVNNHATNMVGTMIAAGIDPDAKGMAFKDSVDAYNWDNDTAEMAHAASSGLKLSEHPYANTAGWKFDFRGDSLWTWYADTTVNETKAYQFGYYDHQAANWDSIAYYAPDYLIVKAAGNLRGDGPSSQPIEHWIPEITESGINWKLSTSVRPLNGEDDGFETLTSASVSKNVLVVGGVLSTTGDFTKKSSIQPVAGNGFGPTDDGRIKPDLVAPGSGIFTTTSDGGYGFSGGTSAASAVVAGSAALIQQHYHNLTGEYISAAALKTLMAHTAEDIGNKGPDYKFGWGLLNTERAARFLSAHAADDEYVIFKDTTLNGETIELQYQHTTEQPLKITIGWTDPAGTVPVQLDDPQDRILVNDLDIEVTDPNSHGLSPWILDPLHPSMAAITGDNDRDNIEQVYVENPEKGWYTINISHKSSLVGESQDVSLFVGPAEPEVLIETISSGNWSDNSNWSGGDIPATTFHRAVIKHNLLLDQSAEIAGITFGETNATLTLNSQILKLHRALFYPSDGTGFFGNDESVLVFRNWDTFSDPLIFDSNGEKLKELSVNIPDNDTLVLGTSLNIYDKLNLSGGTLNTNNQTLKLITDSTHSADLVVGEGKILGALSYSRQYAYQGSGWRLLSVPFDSVLFSSLNESFHTQSGAWADYVISEPHHSNFWLFEESTQSYTGYNGQDSTFTPGEGYLFYMYEDQPDETPILPEPWIVSGDENENMTIPLYRGADDAQSYNLVGNSFAGTLDWHAIYSAGTSLATSYAVWDPSATDGGGTAGFKYYSTDGVGAAGQFIAPMQGFFVQATSSINPELVFDHNQKTPDQTPELFGKQLIASVSPYIQFHLYDQRGELLESEIYLVFNSNASKDYDKSDVIRLSSLSGEQATLSFVGKEGRHLAFESRSMKDGNELLELAPEIDGSGTYVIKWPVWNDIPENWILTLTDGITGNSVDMRTDNFYRFEHSASKSRIENGQMVHNLPERMVLKESEKSRFQIKISANTETSTNIPVKFQLNQNFPNPFNPSTTIRYALPEAGPVRLELFNILGRRVALLIDAHMDAGYHSLHFNASHLASGIYFYRLRAGDYVKTHSMTLIK